MIGWIAAALTLLGVFFTAKKWIACWPVQIMANLVWLVYALANRLPPILIINLIFIILNIYGWRCWLKSKP